MCSIHIIIDKKSAASQAAIQQMLVSTWHRGPDAAHHICHTHSGQTIYIAANRLKITDLRDQANQPMQTPDQQYSLAFNGALYNHLALRHARHNHISFHTHSDTETVLYTLRDHGWQALSDFNGMFALGFYDHAKQTLLVARDRWGMKPLYYADTPDYLVISSELRAILASGLVEKLPNLTQVPHYLAFKFAQPPYTFYKGIYEFEAGGIYQYSVSTGFQKLSHLEVPARRSTNVPLDTNAWIAEAEKQLTQTVTHYLHADVPTGLLLSGGVDSTLLLATAHAAKLGPIPTFTIGYGSTEKAPVTQDHLYARQAARQYGGVPHEVRISDALLQKLPTWVATLDQPVADGAAWLTYLLAQEACTSVSIVWSGAGADELFAGYNRHWAYYQYLRLYPLLKHCPSGVFNTIATLLPDGLWQRALQRLKASPQQTFIEFTAQPSRLARHLLPFTSSTPWSEASSFTEGHLAAALHFDQTHYLKSDVLAITDRMTMQHSIEGRLPYLDAAFSSLAQQLPATFLLQKGKKWLLKELLIRQGGRIYTQRTKEGFGMPFGHWLRQPAHGFLADFLRDPHLLIYEAIDYPLTHQLLHKHLSGKADHSAELWAVLVLALWLANEFPNHSTGGLFYE